MVIHRGCALRDRHRLAEPGIADDLPDRPEPDERDALQEVVDEKRVATSIVVGEARRRAKCRELHSHERAPPRNRSRCSRELGGRCECGVRTRPSRHDQLAVREADETKHAEDQSDPDRHQCRIEPSAIESSRVWMFGHDEPK